MLERAGEKARKGKRGAIFVAADALQLPFADASFDLVTTAFGFRNLANYQSGLREIARVLRCGGEAGILEFAEPRPGPFSALFRPHVLRRCWLMEIFKSTLWPEVSGWQQLRLTLRPRRETFRAPWCNPGLWLIPACTSAAFELSRASSAPVAAGRPTDRPPDVQTFLHPCGGAAG